MTVYRAPPAQGDVVESGPFIGRIRLRRILDEAFHLDAAVSSAASGHFLARTLLSALYSDVARCYPAGSYGADLDVSPRRPRRPSALADRWSLAVCRDSIVAGPLQEDRPGLRPAAIRPLVRCYQLAGLRWEVVCQWPQCGQR
jgi:hypothetical protein